MSCPTTPHVSPSRTSETVLSTVDSGPHKKAQIAQQCRISSEAADDNNMHTVELRVEVIGSQDPVSNHPGDHL